jgi:hypothetical protein
MLLSLIFYVGNNVCVEGIYYVYLPSTFVLFFTHIFALFVLLRHLLLLPSSFSLPEKEQQVL